MIRRQTKKSAVEQLRKIKALPEHACSVSELQNALQLFRNHVKHTEQYSQWACVHNADAVIRVQRHWSEFWKRGDTRFVCQSEGIETVLSVKLQPKTKYAHYTEGCRAAIAEDVPSWLAQQRRELACESSERVELDHTRTQFCDIVREYYSTHPLVEATPHGELWELPDIHKKAFIALHRLRTTDWRDVEPVCASEHKRRTAARTSDCERGS